MEHSSILKLARKDRNQAEIAQKLHVTQATISHWENCEAVPHSDDWKAIADAYGVSLARVAEHFLKARRAS